MATDRTARIARFAQDKDPAEASSAASPAALSFVEEPLLQPDEAVADPVEDAARIVGGVDHFVEFSEIVVKLLEAIPVAVAQRFGNPELRARYLDIFGGFMHCRPGRANMVASARTLAGEVSKLRVNMGLSLQFVMALRCSARVAGRVRVRAGCPAPIWFSAPQKSCRSMPGDRRPGRIRAMPVPPDRSRPFPSGSSSLWRFRAAELDAVDQVVTGEVVGVALAIGDLRMAFDVLDGLLDDRQFEKAAELGYQEIASAFIILQRTLGGLQSAELNRHAFTSSNAEELQCAFEDAEPHVSARLECLKPKPDLTDEERAAAKARFQRRLKEMTSASTY